MSNREIRARAWELCRTDFWKILGASVFVSVVTTVCMSIGMLLGSLGVMMAVAAMLILMPVLEAGMVQFTGNLWNDRYAGIATLFTHTDKVGRIWGIMLQTLLLELVIMLPVMGLLGVLTLLAGSASAAVMVVSIVVAIVMIVAMIWLTIRLSLPLFAMVLNPFARASECIRISWNATRGNVRRIFCHMFILALPLIIMEALLQSFMIFNQTSGVVYFILNLASTLLASLFNGYLTLGQYGLAEQLILHPFPNQ